MTNKLRWRRWTNFRIISSQTSITVTRLEGVEDLAAAEDMAGEAEGEVVSVVVEEGLVGEVDLVGEGAEEEEGVVVVAEAEGVSEEAGVVMEGEEETSEVGSTGEAPRLVVVSNFPHKIPEVFYGLTESQDYLPLSREVMEFSSFLETACPETQEFFLVYGED